MRRCVPYALVARLERSESRDLVREFAPGFATLNPGYGPVLVARLERSESRDKSLIARLSPGFASLNPGYE
jgi:hypothetical protein